jgi:tetratricopeptide (TPR) repeat protein
MDLSPPTGDLQEHPNSDVAQGVNEMHPWNPHRAAKDIEVGDYYWNEKNYRGAEGRYRDALIYKPNDATATFRLAEIMEKTNRPEEAREFYNAYLKILPHGAKADEARKALEKLQAAQAK